ncbi:5'/3'-nucleotidase SurE [Rariglobus hedericola]|uniref:5'-nucleotidase n=1 Tax=Rariglobus hedericola TaxID=2597822 RepID=A0A556QQ29_9BACT|nr:5'/3'-nucleotidase SurE [Rariglobus hedericola]TSJ78750.1 5'/3'-nucleotidase SurE [Rariglobus hedericola]
MRLLITNDDGIDSPFLHALTDALRAARHDLRIAAPKTEQSWIGCAKSRLRPVASAVAIRDFGCPAWMIDGTPSDCVSIALAHLLPPDEPIDAVVSGINIGRNASLGFILASGTIAGAWEGAVHGLPAIAFSQDLTAAQFEAYRTSGHRADADLQHTLDASATRAAQLVPGLVASTPARGFIVHNVNFPYPCGHDTPVHRTIPARVIVPGLFGPAADDGTHRFIFKFGEDISPPSPLTDAAALSAGFISHTVLDYTALGTNGFPS